MTRAVVPIELSQGSAVTESLCGSREARVQTSALSRFGDESRVFVHGVLTQSLAPGIERPHTIQGACRRDDGNAEHRRSGASSQTSLTTDSRKRGSIEMRLLI